MNSPDPEWNQWAATRGQAVGSSIRLSYPAYVHIFIKEKSFLTTGYSQRINDLMCNYVHNPLKNVTASAEQAPHVHSKQPNITALF
jgi:hypothetical protein